MATPAQLVEAVSEATGVPLATVTDIDRRLVIADMRTKAGRGRSAARVTALDAARILTAVLASAQAKHAAKDVTRYAETRVDKARSGDGSFGAAGLNDLAGLSGRHGFVDGLAALITSAMNGDLARLVATKGAPAIEVFAFVRATRGRIRLTDGGATTSVEYIPSKTEPTSRKRDASESASDLEQSRRITQTTILHVAKLLVGE
jgi:hypothetical protein